MNGFRPDNEDLEFPNAIVLQKGRFFRLAAHGPPEMAISISTRWKHGNRHFACPFPCVWTSCAPMGCCQSVSLSDSRQKHGPHIGRLIGWVGRWRRSAPGKPRANHNKRKNGSGCRFWTPFPAALLKTQFCRFVPTTHGLKRVVSLKLQEPKERHNKKQTARKTQQTNQQRVESSKFYGHKAQMSGWSLKPNRQEDKEAEKSIKEVKKSVEVAATILPKWHRQWARMDGFCRRVPLWDAGLPLGAHRQRTGRKLGLKNGKSIFSSYSGRPLTNRCNKSCDWLCSDDTSPGAQMAHLEEKFREIQLLRWETNECLRGNNKLKIDVVWQCHYRNLWVYQCIKVEYFRNLYIFGSALK